MAYTNGSFGADMMRLRWDNQLARAAVGWGHHLCRIDKFQHDSRNCSKVQKYDSVGQNLYVGYGSQYKDEATAAKAAVDRW